MSNFYKNKKILVTGGTGTIGVPLVKKLIELGAKVTVVSLDSMERAKAVLNDVSIFYQGDLRNYQVCLAAAKEQDYVFHLMAVKGCTTIGTSKVASAYVPFLLCNTNMMEAAFRNNVQRYMFVGSIGQYPNLDIRHEDDVWKGPPQANDRFMGIAKRAGETQAEAYLQEFGWDAVRIVRLANVYGPYDDFDPRTAHVIPSLISKMLSGQNPVSIWGDGSQIRDFIYSYDVVEGMLLALEKAPPCAPINLGGGIEYKIKEVAEVIARLSPQNPEIKWDLSKPIGDLKRVLATHRAEKLLAFKARTPIVEGIKQTMEWYIANRVLADRRGRELHG